MKVCIREVVIDSEGDHDLVLMSAQLTQIVRAWLQLPAPAVARPMPISAAPACEGNAPHTAQIAPPEPVTVPVSGNPPADGEGKADLCECGRPKRKTSPKCRNCIMREAYARKRAREGGAHRDEEDDEEEDDEEE